MADEARPLTDDERAELEALRAEKAAREQQAQAARERAELEALRAERAQAADGAAARRQAQAAEDARIQAQRARGAQLMEPDDDLNMPLGQKMVIGVIVGLVVLVVVMHFLLG